MNAQRRLSENIGVAEIIFSLLITEPVGLYLQPAVSRRLNPLFIGYRLRPTFSPLNVSEDTARVTPEPYSMDFTPSSVIVDPFGDQINRSGSGR